jgi:hypothetical protein
MPAATDAASIGLVSGTVTAPIQSTLLTTQSGFQNVAGANMYPQNVGTSLAGLQIRWFGDFQKYIDPDETPFSSSLKTGEAVNQKKVEWGQGFLMPNKATTSAAGIAGTGSGTPPTTDIVLADANHYNRIQLNQQIRNPFTGEHYLVKVKTSPLTITVFRGWAGTPVTADVAARELELLAPAMYENQDTPFVGVAKGATEFNYPELMDRGIWVSDRENNTPDYEFKNGNKYDGYLEKTMKEMAILFEKTSIFGRRALNAVNPEGPAPAGVADTDLSHSYYPTTMGGLDQFTPLYYDLGGAPITEYILQNMLYETWDRVGEGNTPTRLLVGGFMRMALDSLWNGQRYADVKDTETNLVWRRVRTSFGTIEFTLSRYIPSGSAYLLNTDDISKHPYKNGAWKEAKLPSLGPYQRGRFTGDYTIMYRKTAARVKIINASVNPAHYPNL